MIGVEQLLKLLQEVNDEIDFENETALVDDGLLDSLELLKIIAALSDAYDIHIDVAQIEPENFNSAEAILALVKSCQEKKS